ncbi:MAG: ABC transporter permease [Pirellulales bacterium]
MVEPKSAAWRQVMERIARWLGPLFALAAVTLFFAVADRWLADGTFATGLNFRTVTVQTCVVAVAALGMTLIIIAGGIDLSAGTALALCATTLAWGLREDAAYWLVKGDNFASASLRLESSQKRLTAAQRANGKDVERLGEDVRVSRERLRAVLEDKLRDAEQQKSPPTGDNQASTRRKPGSNPTSLLQAKLTRLENPDFQWRSDPQWLDGVPNCRWTPLAALGLCVTTGLLAGFFNGALISGLRMPPFVVTLGSMTIFLGLGNLLSGNVPIRPAFHQIPTWLADLDGNTSEALWCGFPTGVWLAGLLAISVALVLGYTVFGRYVFALGSNESTARLCGVRVGPTKTVIYALGGGLFGIAGIYQFARLSTGNPMSGAGLELEVIAAVVIGGGSLNGGRGTILGTLAGAAMTAVIRSGCTQLGLGDALQRIILGVIIICAVMIDQLRQRRMAAGA